MNTLMQPHPKKIPGFGGHKVVAIASGDEFSLVLDDRGQAWIWGRGDRGQLGLPSEQPSLGEHDRPNQLRPVFKPRPLSGIPKTMSKSRRVNGDGENVSLFATIQGQW